MHVYLYNLNKVQDAHDALLEGLDALQAACQPRLLGVGVMGHDRRRSGPDVRPPWPRPKVCPDLEQVDRPRVDVVGGVVVAAAGISVLAWHDDTRRSKRRNGAPEGRR